MKPEGPHLTEIELHLVLDDGLDPAARRAARGHLDRCRACSERLAQAARLFAAIESWEELPLRRDLSAAVLASIAPPRAPVGLRVATMVQAGVAALVLIAAWPLSEALLSTIQVSTVSFLPPDIVETALAQLAGAVLTAQMDVAANLSLAADSLRSVPGWLSMWPLLVGGALALAAIGNSVLLGGTRNQAAAARRL
jgi:hypothetical protein